MAPLPPVPPHFRTGTDRRGDQHDLEGRLHYHEQEAGKDDGQGVVGLKEQRRVPPLLWHRHVRTKRDRNKDTQIERGERDPRESAGRRRTNS